MINAEYYISQLQLQPHPEGDFYREIYRSRDIIPEGIFKRYRGERNMATSIYFLLRTEDKSHFHQLKSDEIWCFHTGSPAIIHLITRDGTYKKEVLGPCENDLHFQIVIPAGTIFGAEVQAPDNFSLVSCMVAPGFDFADFKLMPRQKMLARFPQHRNIIQRFSKTNNPKK